MAGGRKDDDGKLRYDLNPVSAEYALASVLTFGARKYGDNNWREGIAYSRLIAASKRHFEKWRAGETYDEESGLPHLWHLLTDIAFLIEYEAFPEHYAEFDDRFEAARRERRMTKKREELADRLREWNERRILDEEEVDQYRTGGGCCA